MTKRNLPFRAEIPTLRKSCELGELKEPACVYCKHYCTETICAPEGWCDLFQCKQANTSEEMVCDLYEKRDNDKPSLHYQEYDIQRIYDWGKEHKIEVEVFVTEETGAIVIWSERRGYRCGVAVDTFAVERGWIKPNEAIDVALNALIEQHEREAEARRK